jgi:hypothetical protein
MHLIGSLYMAIRRIDRGGLLLINGGDDLRRIAFINRPR